MAPFDGIFNRGSNQDRAAKAIEDLGSAEAKTYSKATLELAKAFPAITLTLLATIEDHRAEDAWLATEKSLDALYGKTKSTLIDLIDDLNSDDKSKQQYALKMIKQFPQETAIEVKKISSCKSNADMAIRRRERAIGLFEDANNFGAHQEAVIQMLIRFNSDSSFCYITSKGLRKFGAAALPQLLSLLKSNDATSRKGAANFLAENCPKTEEVANTITEALHSLDDKSSELLINTLGKLGTTAKSSIPYLINLLNSNQSDAVVKALRKIAPSSPLILAEGLKHIDPIVRMRTAEIFAIKNQEFKEALPALYLALSDKDKNVKLKVTKAIYCIKPDEAALPYLIQALSSNDPEYISAIGELFKLIGTPTFPVLAQQMDNEEPVARTNAVSILKKNLELPNHIMTDLLIESFKRLGIVATIDPILMDLFSVPCGNLNLNYQRILQDLAPFSSITKKIAEWAVQAASYEHKYSGGSHDAGYISLELSDSAVRCLCNTNTPATSNLLHLVAKKHDISVTMSTGCSNDWTEIVSFENQRKSAITELERRGKPPYDPAEYLNKDIWKSKK